MKSIHILETSTGWVLEVNDKTIGIYATWPKALEDLKRFLSSSHSPSRLRYH